jgi:hypothetical protein
VELAAWLRDLDGEKLVEVGLADLGGLQWIAGIGVEFNDQPAVVAGLTDGGENVAEIQRALTKRQELDGIERHVFEMYVSDAVPVAADESRRIAPTGSQMSGIGAEGDLSAWQQLLELFGTFDDRGEMRVVRRREFVLAGELVDLVKGAGQTVIVLGSGTGGPPGAAANHESFCAEGGR